MKHIFILYILFFFAAASLLAGNNFCFIENKNQWEQNVCYKADIPAGALFLEKNCLTYHLYDASIREQLHAHKGDTAHPFLTMKEHAFQMEFEGCNLQPMLEATNKASEYYNYFLGNDASKWASHVNGYYEINYKELYNGIDLKIYTHNNQLKYEYVVAAQAKPSQINVNYIGANKVSTRNNALVIETSLGEIIEEQPYAYQIINGNKKEVECEFLANENKVSFNFPDGYDQTQELIIDPTLIFSTYSGSFADNFGYTATYDSKGFLYAGSSAYGVGYPTTIGAYSTTFHGGNVDIAITKYDTTGTKRIYSSYLGGSFDEVPHSLVTNSADELFVMGTTSSTDYPLTSSAYDKIFAGGPYVNLLYGLGIEYTNGADIIVSRISADGSSLLASTFLGGSSTDGINLSSSLSYNYADQLRGEIDIDDNDNVFVATCTNSNDFPITSGAIQSARAGGYDGCVVKMDNSLTTVIWSTYLGGLLDDAIYSLAIDANDDIYVSGGTKSTDFYTSTGSVSNSNKGGRADGFVTHINTTGTSILHSTYYGTTFYDQIYFVDLDKKNNVYVFGQTEATANQFIYNATYSKTGGGQFISKFSPELDSIIWSTAFGSGGGVPNISPTAFMVDLCNKIYLSGWGGEVNAFATYGNNAGDVLGMDITSDAFQKTTDGSDFYLMVLQDDASGLVYGSYIGGNQSPDHVDGGTSRFDRKGKMYEAVCAGCGYFSDFPIYPSNAVSASNNADCNNAVFKFDFLIPTIVADFTPPKPDCVPYNANFVNTSLEQANTSYYWDFGDGGNSTQKNPTHTYTQAGFYDIMLVVNDPTSCNLTDTIIKQIAILADTSYKLTNEIICQQNSLQIGITPFSDPSITYTWSPSTGLSDTSVANPIASPTQTTNYILLISNGNCTDTLYQTVFVNSIIDPSLLNLYADLDTIFKGESTQLHLSPSSGYVYLWTPSSSLNSANIANPTATPEVTTKYIVSIQDSSSSACELTDTITIVVVEFDCKDPYIFVPSAFSPNGDGSNDVLYVRGNFIAELYLTIYNRWGEEVFSTTDQTKGWDGTYKGMPADPAVFVYYIKAKCVDGQEYFKKGNVTLIR